MDREKYNNCMKPYISGSGLGVEERRLRFCVGAKICSGKAKSEDEARKICLIPKPPKPVEMPGDTEMAPAPRAKKSKKAGKVERMACRQEAHERAECIVERLGDAIDKELAKVITAAVVECQCG